MRTFKYFLLMMMTMLAALTFMACEKDDTDFSYLINNSNNSSLIDADEEEEVSDNNSDNTDKESDKETDEDTNDAASDETDENSSDGKEDDSNIESGDENDAEESNDENVETNEGTASVLVKFNNSSVTVNASSDVANYITVTKSGAHVSITQSDNLATEITYTLSGSSSDGEFYMAGSYKATVEFNGLTLTNASPVYSGAAVHIQNSKRINVKVMDSTTNTLTDSSNGDQKGALYIKGHAEFKQKGTLNVYGKLKHGIKTGEYMTVKNATINIKSAVGDGINVSEYFLMESGTISISGVGDDGIQSDIDGTTSTGETTDHEDEDSGNIYLQGGTITATITNAASKGIKAEGDMFITDGSCTVKTTGNGAYDSDDNDAKGCAGLKADGTMNISGGSLNLSSSGSGASVSNGSAYQASSYSKGTWYALYNSSNSPAFAFKVPSNGSMGTPMVVYTTGTTSLKSGVTGSGTSFWSGYGYSSCSGGSSVSLSTYSGGNGGGGNPGGNQGGVPGGRP